MAGMWQSFKITNDKDLRLSCLFRQANPVSLSEENSKGSSPLVVVCHGFTGSKEGGGRALDMGNALAEGGYSTLLFDFAGCGESDGNWIDLTLSNQIEDLGSVIKWSRLQGFDRIIITGRSFGGSTVICYGAYDKKIDAVCSWAALAKPDEYFRRFTTSDNLQGSPEDLVAIKGEKEDLLIKRKFFQGLSKHAPLKSAAKIAPRPFLIIHGSADLSVPCSDAFEIFERAKDPKSLSIIEGADHRFSEHNQQVWKIFFNWLGRFK